MSRALELGLSALFLAEPAVTYPVVGDAERVGVYAVTLRPTSVLIAPTRAPSCTASASIVPRRFWLGLKSR